MPVPSPHLSRLTRVMGPRHALPAAVRFISVTNLMGNTSGNRNLNGRFLAGVHRARTVNRIIHYFRGSGVVRISNGIGPTSSVRIVGARLTLTSLSAYRHTVRHMRGGTGNNSGSTGTRLTILRGYLPRLRGTNVLHTLSLDTRRGTTVHCLDFLALGPAVCVTGIGRSNFRGGPCLSRIHRVTTGRNSIIIPIYTTIRTSVTRLSSRRHSRFVRRLKLRRPNLGHIVHTNCGLLGLRACFATKIGRIHT